MNAATAADRICEKFQGTVLDRKEFRGEQTLVLKPEDLVRVCEFAKTELGFDFLTDITSVDHFGEDPRFEVVYELYGLGHRTHLRLKVRVPEDDPVVDSVVGVWATANWHEREIWDMMGIRFRNHPDLRRILMWEGYPYFPLRKDFPLAGLPTELPDVAFTKPAPLEGGPFVAAPTSGTTVVREPRARELTNMALPEDTGARP